METTFISIHDLTPEAHILYSSDSVIDILGYTPDEIVNRSAWEFFSKDELPEAQEFHRKRVTMDKAAVLAYCNVMSKSGDWINCECCFTIVYDVMIVCTSIYQRGGKAQGRALAAPIVRRIFSASPKDPRYHMLSHISAKFTQPSKAQLHEPRAALFLNRFTRTLTIMYATSALEEVIGIPAAAMRGRSFYYCIAENCLQDSIKCIENAKGNDSIAYLRFWFRDPRTDDPAPAPDADSDDEMTTEMSEDMSEGGVQLRSQGGISSRSTQSSALESSDSMDVDTDTSAPNPGDPNSRTSSGDSGNENETHEAIFGESRESRSSASSIPSSPETPRTAPTRATNDPIELEAVISCTSDGLVVCLRKARPAVPRQTQPATRPVHEPGMFAAPWASQPVLPPLEVRAGSGGLGTSFAPSLGPMGARHDSASPPRAHSVDHHDFMSAIRDQAVFAWALTGINGALGDFAKGKPRGDATPADGFAVWANDASQASGNLESRQDVGLASNEERRAATQMFGDPGLGRNNGGSNGNGAAAR
ncbi:hypothetical protein WHR41_08855 [Cladosporium halotolerans]|uniref:PAS domain-containing protein n=1 Tax=Cladosporium halotolerans TaxID=1052096 RepID=A0AB34KBY6_9PEZI